MEKSSREQFLRGYLGAFAVGVESSFRDGFLVRHPAPGPVLSVGRLPFLRQVGACFLLAWGVRSVRHTSTQRLLDAYLGDRGEDNWVQFDAWPERYVTVLNYAGLAKNKLSEEILVGLATGRALDKKVTCVLSEIPVPEVLSVFRSRGWGVEIEGGESGGEKKKIVEF